MNSTASMCFARGSEVVVQLSCGLATQCRHEAPDSLHLCVSNDRVLFTHVFLMSFQADLDPVLEMPSAVQRPY